jgi:hypothetical protein
VEHRRLQAEAKSHKLGMRTQQQELRHQKRSQGLEYASQFRETYGATPITMAVGGIGAAALIGFLVFGR